MTGLFVLATLIGLVYLLNCYECSRERHGHNRRKGRVLRCATEQRVLEDRIQHGLHKMKTLGDVLLDLKGKP